MNSDTTNKNFEEELRTSDLYSEEGHWYVNAGGKTIHAARVKGFFRNLKWYAQSFYLLFFIGPYLKFNGEKAIFFDIPHRQFHLFGLTIWPQDIWILALTLIAMAITLVGVTAIAGRVFCGYFCFHTVWVDWFTLIEQFIEGSPGKRRKLDGEKLSFKKISLKLVKYLIWISIALFTGFSFTAYFMHPGELISAYIHFDAPYAAWASLILMTTFTFVFPGFMREQVCFWLCPYARIQSVMVDKDSIVPTYDFNRGEPRTKYSSRSNNSSAGDCIDCNSCYNVCPTGVDIRNGLQEGCITCGMCIDACNIVMKKTGKPKGLIRYMSRHQVLGEPQPKLFKRPRVWIYSIIFLLSTSGIIYGLSHLDPVQFTVLHQRQPLYTKMSDGSIQNKYTIKLLNKTTADIVVDLKAEGHPSLEMTSDEQSRPVLKAGKMIPFSVFLRLPPGESTKKDIPVTFHVSAVDNPEINLKYKSVFVGPK